jgi:hypothetical protein
MSDVSHSVQWVIAILIPALGNIIFHRKAIHYSKKLSIFAYQNFRVCFNYSSLWIALAVGELKNLFSIGQTGSGRWHQSEAH